MQAVRHAARQEELARVVVSGSPGVRSIAGGSGGGVGECAGGGVGVRSGLMQVPEPRAEMRKPSARSCS